jgi:predicted 2-oxoglutarate/Fe(II)-dependent dioxygenase YbiX/peroxiredoxin
LPQVGLKDPRALAPARGAADNRAMSTEPATLPPLLTAGDPAPYFSAAALDGNPAYTFDTVAGRVVLMLFFGSASRQDCAAALALVAANRSLFDDEHACFFGITIDPSDAAEQRIRPQIPGIRFFLDYDRNVSRLYRAASDQAGPYRPHWLVLDRMLRVAGRFALDQGAAAIAAAKACTAPAPLPDWAPVLMVPRLFDADLCRTLIDYHAAHGDEESGFMRDVGGKSRLIHDNRHKVRRDCLIRDEPLRQRLQRNIMARLLPMVERAFQFRATRMERYLIGCYSAESGGHFRPHRDNTTKSTEHRRFAITINLNAEDYEGGELRFPEYGARTYRAPTGGAVVFSCGLLHEATRVTKGTRLAFLPFLYDEEAAAVRERNNRYLGEEIKPYEAAAPPS